MSISEWIASIVGTDSDREIARKTGVPQATLSRQRKAGFAPATVVAIARGYGEPPIRGLIAIGLLRDEDVPAAEVARALRLASDEDLVAEVLERIKRGSDHELLTTPVAPVIDFPPRGEWDPQRTAAGEGTLGKDGDPELS